MLILMVVFATICMQSQTSQAIPSMKGKCSEGCPVVIRQNCPGVVKAMGECGCHYCITDKLKGPGEVCGDVLEFDGVCDERQSLRCMLPLEDRSAMTGTCEPAPQVLVAPPPQKETWIGKMARFFG